MDLQDIVSPKASDAAASYSDCEQVFCLDDSSALLPFRKQVYFSSFKDSIPSAAEYEWLIEEFLATECDILTTLT